MCRRRQWHPTPVLLPGKSHGWRSLEGCSPWGRWGSGTTERLHFHFSLSCIGEGNAAHSSVLAWRIPGTGEPGGLLSMGSHRVRHDWSDLGAYMCVCVCVYTTCKCLCVYVCVCVYYIGEGHVNALQYTCLENPMDRRPWQTTVHRVRIESDMMEAT